MRTFRRTPVEDALQQYAEAVHAVTSGSARGLSYSGASSYLLQHGRWFNAQPLPKGVRRGVPRLCFHNALILARRRRWAYVEGLALGEGLLPVHHAWVVRPDDPYRVIDPTWSAHDRECAYLGCFFPLEFVKSSRNHCHTVLDDWQHDFPVLRGEVPAPTWEMAGDRLVIPRRPTKARSALEAGTALP